METPKEPVAAAGVPDPAPQAAPPPIPTNGRAQDEAPSNPVADALAGGMDQVNHWVEHNQTLALLAGFGLGVFLGVMIRG